MADDRKSIEERSATVGERKTYVKPAVTEIGSLEEVTKGTGNPGTDALNVSVLSDRNLKENIAAIAPQNVLGRVATLPIHTWNYKSDDPSIRHIGPMAQDFAAAFGVGKDDRVICTVDAFGVAFAAIQGLHQIVEEQKEEIRSLRAEVDDLRKKIDGSRPSASGASSIERAA